MGEGHDLSRRRFMQAGVVSALTLSPDAKQAYTQKDISDPNEYEYQGVADLLGPDSARPEPGGGFFENKVYYAYRYEATDTGARYFITQADNSWTVLSNTPTTQVDEVRTENFTSFFNHTFARPEAPSDKNWNYTAADVTKHDSEIELAATTTLTSTQYGNYPAGSEAIPGVALRLTGAPTAGSAQAGYYDANNGGGVGEDTTDSYVFLRNGGTTHKVHRQDWNGYQPSGRLWVNDRPTVTRFPHLFYGGGDFKVRALIHGQESSDLKTLHTFTPDNVPFPDGPPFSQPNLPITFESNSLSGGKLRANAAHYEFGEVETEQRVNGDHFTGVSAGTSGWTPLLIFRKRPGWEMVNVKPLRISAVATSADAKLALQLDPTLSSVSTSLPPNTSSDETAIEIVSASFDSPGERRWVGYAAAGQGNNPGQSAGADLTFNVPANQDVAVVAQGVGGAADLSGTVSWEEYF